MFNRISNFLGKIKINTLYVLIVILCRKKTRKFDLKYLEMKLNIITLQEFEAWVLLDAQGI